MVIEGYKGKFVCNECKKEFLVNQKRYSKPLFCSHKCYELWDVSNGITYCKEYHINSKELHRGILNKIKEIN